MPSDYSPSGSRRSPRRGGRRPGRQRGDDSFNRKETSTPARKKSLWESIVSFFSGESAPKPKTRSNGNSEASSPAPRRNDKPQRTSEGQGPRKPEFVEVSSPRLYVGNLSFDAAESDLFDLFNGVGLVQNVEVVSNRHTMKSKGFAFVQMQTIDEAKRAVSELHDKEYMGRKLVVSGAKALEEKRNDRGRQPEQ